MAVSRVAYDIWECDAGCDNIQSTPSGNRPEGGIEIYLTVVGSDGKEITRSAFAHSMECAKELAPMLLIAP